MKKPTHITLRIETVEAVLSLISTHKLSDVIDLWNTVQQEINQSMMIQQDQENNNGNV